MDVKRAVLWCRQKCKMTQAEFAAEVGCSSSLIAMLETGARQNPRHETIEKISEVARIKVSKFWEIAES